MTTATLKTEASEKTDLRSIIDAYTHAKGVSESTAAKLSSAKHIGRNMDVSNIHRIKNRYN